MRFPETAALLEREGVAVVKALLADPALQGLVKQALQELYMASIKELTEALNAAKGSVDTLAGKVGNVQGGIDPADLDPVLQEVTTLRQTVEALASSLPEAKPAAAEPAV